jgi:hypothetical protein
VAYLLDYSGPDGFPQQLAQHVSTVVVLDHHKTAAAQLADSSSHPQNLHVHLDMQRSGAAIARDFFSPPGMSEQLQHMFRWGGAEGLGCAVGCCLCKLRSIADPAEQ